MRRLALILTAALIASLVTFFPVVESEPADAATASDFNPGNIISDANFFDSGAMSAIQVQQFLESQVRSCQNGFTCLRDYAQATPTMPANSYCTAYPGSAGERASDIIARVGQACGISQKVLLVLLQKEQSLVTLTNPGATRYRNATGFACPDTAPCDPAYSGFFYQVYYAARQFQNYTKNPNSWNYRAGRVNSVLFHPNAACGRADVYIVNQATANLYIYTPYQPNGAALANLYGTGDGCSSYGNRNFWRLFSDWFGSPTEASSLARTVDNGTVYLLADGAKHPVNSLAALAGLAPLGKVGFVSQSYLDRFPTRHAVGRSLRDPGGTIYFYDAGIKLAFTSCQQAIDYGASCEADGYVQLSDAQAAAFVTGPFMTSVLGTVEGGRYYIRNRTKAEILDAASQAAAGIPTPMNVLTENAVAHLALVAPVVRDAVFVRARGTTSTSLLVAGARSSVPAPDATGASTRIVGALTAQSLALIPTGRPFVGLATVNGQNTMLEAGGRRSVTAGGLDQSAYIEVPTALADSYPQLPPIGKATFFKSPTKADVYVTMPNDIRPVSDWASLMKLTTDAVPTIHTVPQPIVELFPRGPVALTSGTLVRSPDNATVYLVNGVTSRYALSSFVYTTEAGFTEFTFSTSARIDAYPLEPALIGFAYTCGSQLYVAAGGSLHPVAPEDVSRYPLASVALDEFLCAEATIGAPAPAFIRDGNGGIYQLVNGQKRPVSSMARLEQLGGTTSWMQVHQAFANAIPTGPLA